MEGREKGFETASFSQDSHLYFNYYSESFLEKELTANGLMVLQKYKQDYIETDGQILVDHIFFAKKHQ